MDGNDMAVRISIAVPVERLPSVIVSEAKDLRMRKSPILRPFVVFATQGDGGKEHREPSAPWPFVTPVTTRKQAAR
jgi:hypothetical protein